MAGSAGRGEGAGPVRVLAESREGDGGNVTSIQEMLHGCSRAPGTVRIYPTYTGVNADTDPGTTPSVAPLMNRRDVPGVSVTGLA